MRIRVEKTKHPKARPSEDSLGFGKYFSDHMFVVDFSAESLSKGAGVTEARWHDPRVVPYAPFAIDPAAAALHYGQAIFEGMKAFRGVDGRIRLFRPAANWARMRASAERLCMEFIDQETFVEGLFELVRTDLEWVPKHPGTSLYLRPTLIASEAFLGVRPAQRYIFFVIASPVGAYYGDTIRPVKIWVEKNYSRAATGGIGATKAAGNYASSLKAALEAQRHGYAQVLWLDAAQKRYVEEVGTMNVFFVIGEKLVTPSLSGTILPGVTRDCVIEIARHWGRTVEERPIALEEIVEAHARGQLKEAFGTGTAASITPVSTLGLGDRDLVINNGEVGALSGKLYSYLTGLQYGEIEDPRGWTVEVPLTGESPKRDESPASIRSEPPSSWSRL